MPPTDPEAPLCAPDEQTLPSRLNPRSTSPECYLPSRGAPQCCAPRARCPVGLSGPRICFIVLTLSKQLKGAPGAGSPGSAFKSQKRILWLRPSDTS